jgi:hypothetical protein
MTHSEAFVHDGHRGFRPEFLGRDQPARNRPYLENVCKSGVDSVSRDKLGLTASFSR